MSNWYVYEQLSRMRQDEICRDVRSARMDLINLRAVLANRRVLLTVGLPLALAFIGSVLAGQLTLN
jgi:hypothetical protein